MRSEESIATSVFGRVKRKIAAVKVATPISVFDG